MKPETIGNSDLSAWQVAPGVIWIQTRSPHFARKLSRRADSRLVAHGVAGGYLRIYEFTHGLAWAARLIARYTQNDTVTNASKIPPAFAASKSECAGSIKTVSHLNRHAELARP